jgi:hypothetical protein
LKLPVLVLPSLERVDPKDGRAFKLLEEAVMALGGIGTLTAAEALVCGIFVGAGSTKRFV